MEKITPVSIYVIIFYHILKHRMNLYNSYNPDKDLLRVSIYAIIFYHIKKYSLRVSIYVIIFYHNKNKHKVNI